MTTKLLTRQEAASFLSVPISKIDSLVRQRTIPFVKLPGNDGAPGRYIRFNADDLHKWLEGLTKGGGIDEKK